MTGLNWEQRAHYATFGICPPCHEAWRSWFNYRIVPGLRINSGATRDDTLAGIKDRQRARFEEWRDTIRSNQELIEKICARRHRRQFVVVQLPIDEELERAA
jgi:hypothetical protein